MEYTLKIEEIAYTAAMMGKLKKKAKKILNTEAFDAYGNVMQVLIAALGENVGEKKEKDVSFVLDENGTALLRWFLADVSAKMPWKALGEKRLLEEIYRKVA